MPLSTSCLTLWVSALALLASLPLLACDDSSGTSAGSEAGSEAGSGAGVEGLDPWFEDHTHPHARTLGAFEALSVEGHGGRVLKFLASGFEAGGGEHLRLLEGGFYKLHDELYWMRLLNGARAWGFEEVPPVEGLSLESVEAAYTWATAQQAQGLDLPLDLTFTRNGRLYSPYFYERALARPRQVALGTIIHLPPQQGRARPEELWLYELELSDVPTAQEIAELSARLRAALPPEAEGLSWLIRSQAQEQLAQELEREGLPEGDHLVRYHELVVPGEVQVYSEGLTAGRVRGLEEGEPLNSSPNDLLVMSYVPDDLPPASGLITALPQTPLAHVNLLAQNRNIPNLYVAGALEHPVIRQLLPTRAPAVLWATGADEWRLAPISSADYNRYLALLEPAPRELPEVNLAAQPDVYDLSALTLSQALALRPVIGGKAAGLVACLEEGGATPFKPLVITGKLYQEQLSEARERLSALLSRADVRRSSATLRLGLEGWSVGLLSSESAASVESLRAYVEELRAQRGEEDSLVWWVSRGGVQGYVRSRPIEHARLASLLSTLTAHFEPLSPQQGLRFRSSSNVEDLEGFNGAGLYSSETGYLYPQALSGSARSKSVAWALREVWASYWSLEAFQEREREGIEHLSGHMSALVHPNFQDEAELSNGVLTLTLTPPTPTHLPFGAPTPTPQPIAVALINAQAGSLSVTNPERVGALPEVLRVELWESASGEVEAEVLRLQRSTEQPEVLSDEQATELARRALTASERWLALERQRATPAQAPTSLVLDLEFRGVEAWWPLARRPNTDVSSGGSSEVGAGEARLVLKQARPLEPSSADLSDELKRTPAPRDALARASVIEALSCERAEGSLTLTRLYTDPLRPPLLGYERAPLLAQLSMEGEVSWEATHLELRVRSSERGAPWALSLSPRVSAAEPPLASLSLTALDQVGDASAQGRFEARLDEVRAAQAQVHSEVVTCERSLLFSSPREFLRSLLGEL